jgi:phage baseplate assembly protein V
MRDNDQFFSKIRDIFRIGEVVSTNTEKGTARVQFHDVTDRDGTKLVSFDLQTLHKGTLRDKNMYTHPIGAQVACLFLGNGMEEGVILGELYNAKDATPTSDANDDMVLYRDNTLIRYNFEKHLLTIDVQGEQGSIEVHTNGNIKVVADGDIDVTAKGNVKVSGARIDLN